MDRRGVVLLIKGKPGTGKTTLALEFLAEEDGGDIVHISSRTPLDRLAASDGLFPEVAARANVHLFTTVGFDPTQFAVANNLITGLFNLLSTMHDPIVVLDSWEGIADRLPEDGRQKVEQALLALLEATGGRMILVSEEPDTDSTLDVLADAVLVLHHKIIDDRRVRELEVRKLRGLPMRQSRYLFTLASARFRHLEPFRFNLPPRTAMFHPLPNTATHMSTGSRDLDALLEGGLPRGSTVLMEIRGDLPFDAQVYVPMTEVLNILAVGNAVMAFLYSDYDPTRARLFTTRFLPEDVYDAAMRVFSTDVVEDAAAIKFSLNPSEDFPKWLQVYEAFKRTGKDIGMLMALDTVQNLYGEGVMGFLATVASRAAVNHDIQLVIARPNLELTPKVANISQIHLVLAERCGTLVLCGMKPRTGYHALQFSFAQGYPQIQLVPLEDLPLAGSPRPHGPSAEEVPAVRAALARAVTLRADFFETVTESVLRAKQEAEV